MKIFFFFFFFYTTNVASCFRADPLLDTYRFTATTSHQMRIDPSHNHIHGKEVLFWAHDILSRLSYRLHRNDLDMIAHMSLLHDLLDKKYDHTPYHIEEEMTQHLLGTTLFSPSQIDMMIRIMKCSSYTWTVLHGYPTWLMDQPIHLQEVYHIFREADLLASYNLARMIEYRWRRCPWMTNEEVREESLQFYESRIGTQIQKKLFVHEEAEDRAKQLDALCRLRLSLLHYIPLDKDHMDILRVIHHLDIYRLAASFRSLPTIEDED